jgi:hypothetical protein
MKLSKYRITVQKLDGFALVVYQDGLFKSFLTDVKPPFNQQQLKWILSHIPANEIMLAEHLIFKAKGMIELEKLGTKDATAGEGKNNFIALFCDKFKEKTTIIYKVSAADAGKIKVLPIKREEWLPLLKTYFESTNFLFINKWSIANLVKYYNELRLETFADLKTKKNYPLPYDHLFFTKLDMEGQKEYWAHLRENGYKWDANASRNGKWVKEDGMFGA